MQTRKALLANPAVVLREEFDDWAILYNPDTGVAVGVNPVGKEIWKLLDGQHTREDLIAWLREHYRDVPPAVDEEVGAFLADLDARGLAGRVLAD